MRLRKLLGICSGLTVAACTLAACSSGGGSAGSAGGPVQLTILTHYDSGNPAMQKALKNAINTWNAGHPSIHVTAESVPFADLLSTLTAHQVAGKVPDLVQAYSLWGGQLQSSDVMATPPASVISDIHANYSSSVVQSVSVNGTPLGFPGEVQTYGLFYNKKLFAQAGISAPPSTWPELHSDAVKLTQKTGSGAFKVQGFALGNTFDSIVVHPFLSLAQAAGGKITTSSTSIAGLTSPAAEQALAFETGLVNAGVTDPSINVLTAFPSGHVGMTINAEWMLGSTAQAAGVNPSDFGTAPIPGPSTGEEGSLLYSFFYGVTSRSQHPQQAWQFLTWLCSQKTANGATTLADMLANTGTSLPSRTSDVKALASKLSDPNLKPFIDALSYAATEPNSGQGQEIKTDLQNQIEAAWTHKATVIASLQAAQSQIDSLLQSNG